MELQKKGTLFIRIVLSFLGTYGVCYLCDLAGIDKAAYSVLGLLVLFVLFWGIEQTSKMLADISDKKLLKRRVIFSFFVCFLFALTMIMGYQLQRYGLTDGGFKGKGLLVLRALCLTVALFPFGNLLFAGLEKIDTHNVGNRGKHWKTGAVFGISAVVIFLCLIPVWLAYYPIIMSYDFHRQVNEAVAGFAYFWPYQPIAHTWIIWVFLQLGYAMGDLEAGFAGMALFQMLLYSLVAAYATSFMYRVTKRKWVVVLAILFFGVLPVNTVLVMCTTKDVIFTILFLLFLLILAERFFFAEGKKKLWLDLGLFFVCCFMAQFRNNAIYAVVVFGVFWVIFAAKKERLRVLLLCVLLVVGSKVTGVIIKEAIGTEMGTAKVEMYSVPIQQFARVGLYHSHELDESTRATLEQYVPERYWEGYNPPLADTVKAGIGAYVFPDTWDGNEAQVLFDWAKIGLKYPNDYLDAFLELTRGYWFWDDRSHAECLGYGVEGRMGLIYTYNSAALGTGGEILHESKFPWLEEQLEKVVSGNCYYNWPVLSLLFKPAFYFWGICLMLLAFLYLKRKEQAVFSLFTVLYMATMLLGPVVQIRYVFPAIVALPLLVVLLWFPQKVNENVNE